MHRNPAFHAAPDELVARAAAIGFAHIFAATPAGPMVVHAPVTRHGEALRFHVARANRLAPHLDGARLLLSLVDSHGYVSPNWYVAPADQVPTWNYVAIEIDGQAAAIDDAALVEHLDTLADTHEPRPTPWTRAKMDPLAFAKLLRAIQGFTLTPAAMRGTTKLSQNKPAADRAGVVAGLVAQGNDALAAAMRAALDETA